MTELDAEVLKKSVTRAETEAAKTYTWWFGSFALPYPLLAMPPDPPAWYSREGDEVLASTVDYEDKWANAIAIAATRCSSLEFEVDGEVGLRVRRMHDLLTAVDGMQGWAQFVAKHMQDFLTTDNGAFIEIVRASKAIGSRIVGLLHLDSRRCWRTGDPQRPVVYQDRLGALHELRDYQVIAIADMPTPRLTFNGVGRCAARRVYNTIYRMAAIERYISEKVSGRRPLALHLVNGINDKQIKAILSSAAEDATARGLAVYQGAAVAGLPTDITPNLITIPFSDLPDNFDLEQERSNARLEYANTIGLDIQDLQPGAIGGSLGSATQAQVLDTKAKGKGLAYWRRAFTEQLNLKVLPEATTFAFIEKDYRDEIQQADAQLRRAQVRTAMIASGEITPRQALQMGVDAGDIPKEFLPEDETPDTNIASYEKPVDEEHEPAPSAYEPQPEPITAAGPRQQSAAQVAARDIPRGAQAGASIKEAFGARFVETLKANRVELITIAPAIRARFPGQRGESRLVEATNALEEYVRALVEAAKEECPADKGVMADTIRYEIKGRNTREPVAHVYAGNKERPEVAVRATLFGRRGFGPKKPGGVLVFEGKDGETVYTRHVGGTEPNNWLARALKRTEAERRALARRIGALETEEIDVADVMLRNAPNIDGYDERKPDEIPNNKRNRRAGVVIE